MPLPHEMTRRARELRQNQTEAERLLWTAVRNRNLCGLKFRRQYPIGPWIVDFACFEHLLVVELDGGYHDYRLDEDIRRQKFLQKHGWTVLRFENDEVLRDIEAVCAGIANGLNLPLEFTRRKSP